MATNIYQRGTTFWWRRSVRYGLLNVRPITVRISLKTRCPRDARARAAHLETELMAVGATVVEELKVRLSAADLGPVYKEAFEAKLDQYLVKQASTPGLDHGAVDLVYARYFTLLAGASEHPHADDDLRIELRAKGLSEKDMEALFLTVAMHGRTPAIRPPQIGEYLERAGVKPSMSNMEAAARMVAAAYRDACLAAGAAFGSPVSANDVWPLPKALQMHIPTAGEPLSAKTSSDAPQTERSRPQEGDNSGETIGALLDVPLSEITALCITAKTDSKEWREDRRRDVNAAVNLFIAANGDVLLSRIKQRHCSAMVALFPHLPTRYGHTQEDIAGGFPAIIARGARLHEQWSRDSVAAERDKLPTVGFAEPTHNKHLTWLKAVFAFAQAHGYVSPDVDLTRLKRKVRGKKGGRRLPWTPPELKKLFAAPVWHGCAGLWNRFDAGPVVFHDGWYFGPLLIVTTGGRCEEPIGATLDDVFDEAEIPFIHFRPNSYRLLKNEQSDRRLPLSPALIDLGFLDYVRELRTLGHDLLFPEMYNSTASMSFDHVFYDKVFEPLRATQFSGGTSQKRGRKDVDVASIRTAAARCLRDAKVDAALRQYWMGHVPAGETAASYEGDPGLDLLLPLVKLLDGLLPDLPVHPLRLRPKEWQKFGAPSGRRAGL